MNVTRRMIVIPVATVMAAGIGAGAFAVGLIAAQDVPEAVTAGHHVLCDDGRPPGVLGRRRARRRRPRRDRGSHRSRSTPRPTRCASTSSFTDVDPITADAHPPRCGRRQRTDRRGLRSHPGSGTVRHLRPGTSASPTRSRRTRSASTSTPTRRPFPAGAVRGQLAASFELSPTCCRHRFVCTTPACRTRSAHRRSSRTRPPSST